MSGHLGRAAEALVSLFPLDSVIEIPELHVRLEGDCGFYKDFDVCIPLSMLISAVINLDPLESSKSIEKINKIYWPQKGKKGLLQLLLLLLADAYPGAVSVGDLRSIISSLGFKPESIRKIMYRLYHHYNVVERLGYGVYRLKDQYYNLLITAFPDWRVRLYCLLKSSQYSQERCEEALLYIKKSIIYLASKYYIRSRRVAKSREESRKSTNNVILRDSVNILNNELVGLRCSLNIDHILNVIQTMRPALYEELAEDRRLAAEIIAVLYSRSKKGRPYIVGVNREILHTTIADEAYSILGSSSSLWQTLDWDKIREVMYLLKSANIIFIAKYGKEYKIRIDKQFEALLDSLDSKEVIRCEA